MSDWKGIIAGKFTATEFTAYLKTLVFADRKPSLVVLHNTASPKLSEWHDYPGLTRMHGLESYYRDTQKWSAGPHLFVADDAVWAFTPLTTTGVHSPSWNPISWGVEVVGDYDTETLPADVKENVLSVLTDLHRLAGLDPTEALKFHHEDPLTTHRGCPGANLVKSEIVSLVVSRLVC